MLKLYVIVRGDLAINHQAVQGMHAVAEFAARHPKDLKDWQASNNTIVFLQSANLEALVETTRDGGFTFAEFYEPDCRSIGHAYECCGPTLTAIVVAPNWLAQNVMFKDLPLAVSVEDAVDQALQRRCGEIVDSYTLNELRRDSDALKKLRKATPKERRAYFARRR